MTPEDYNRIQSIVSLPFGACPSVTALRRDFPKVKNETWLAIYGQEQQYKVIRSHHLHKANVINYLARYANGEDVLQLSADVDFPPCMLLRRMLEKIIDAPKQAVSDALRHPDRLDSSLCPGVPAPLLARLRADVVRCAHADCCYSPLSDVAKQVTGLEYELYLQQRLAEAGLAFWSEGELRQLGFHKTPDCKLKVPVAVRSRSGSEHLVCWVDSKATFGDHRTHIKQVEEQYCTYVNRYGPGMVIYWFGFVEDLNTDPHVLLCDDFPDTASIIKIADSVPIQLQQQQAANHQQQTGGCGHGVVDGGGGGGGALANVAANGGDTTSSNCTIKPLDNFGGCMEGATDVTAVAKSDVAAGARAASFSDGSRQNDAPIIAATGFAASKPQGPKHAALPNPKGGAAVPELAG